MTKRKRGREVLKPSEEAHRQVVELLELGERSSNPDIRAAAIQIAKETSTGQHAQAGRVRPSTAMWAGTLVFASAALACSYFLIQYPGPLGRSVSATIVVVAVLLVGLYALLSGNLSQDNFTKLCTAAWDKFKGWLPGSSPGQTGGIAAQAETESARGADDDPAKS